MREVIATTEPEQRPMKPLKAPFPWFGGKRLVAPLVWKRLGDVPNYIEPFAGSIAMLLLRPDTPRIETINDADFYVANFWRATAMDPEAVADYADWPVDEIDLHARHAWLVRSEHAAEFRERMRSDPDYFDAKVAGWWCWGLCCWIGSGWCEESRVSVEQVPRSIGGQNGYGWCLHPGQGQMPNLRGDSGAAGSGVTASAGHKKRPRFPESQSLGAGVNSGEFRRPQLADAYSLGRGVNADCPEVMTIGGTCDERRRWLRGWFCELRDRLRTTRRCCGHWLRVCDSPSVTTRLGTTAIFLDPPYAKNLDRLKAWIAHLNGDGPEPEAAAATSRAGNLYANDKTQDVDRLVAEVHRYCLERGSNPEFRIALCGYEGEHNALEQHGWEVVEWKAAGGYGNRTVNGQENAARERVWFSPHCLKVTKSEQRPLF